jgi:hypothetical protein
MSFFLLLATSSGRYPAARPPHQFIWQKKGADERLEPVTSWMESLRLTIELLDWFCLVLKDCSLYHKKSC